MRQYIRYRIHRSTAEITISQKWNKQMKKYDF